jgi:hypothetical protein
VRDAARRCARSVGSSRSGNHDDHRLVNQCPVEDSERERWKKDPSEFAFDLWNLDWIFENACEGDVNLVAKPLADCGWSGQIPGVGGIDVLGGLWQETEEQALLRLAILRFKLSPNLGPEAS